MHNGVAGAAAVRRAATIDRLTGQTFDLLVIGGGIVGAGVAWLAAAQGLQVALLERSDFGSATSSASSKLIHGGLRYLRMGDVRLVREALREERALVSTIAPHLVRPLPFLLPVYDDGPYGRAAIRSALWLYRTLAGDGAFTRLLPAGEAASIVPSLRVDRLRGAGTYEDAQTNDARLCLAAVAAADDEDAAVLNYAEVVGLSFAGGGETRATVTDRRGDESFEVAATAVVNAAGPWIDQVRRLEHPGAGTSVTLSKGAHVLLPQPGPWGAALTIPVDRSRVSFAIPWEGMLMLGTTDDAFEGDPAEVAATPADDARIFSEAARALPDDVISPESVLARFAGLRVLPDARRGTAAARRETIVTRGAHGMVSVAGGKLTTFRHIAASVLDAVHAQRRSRPIPPALPLPGAGDAAQVAAELQERWPDVGDDTAALFARTYGTRAAAVLEHAGGDPEALAPLVAGQPEIAAQVAYARDREWAVTAQDVLRRRTTLALRGFDSPELRGRIAAALGAPDPAVERA